MGRPPSRDQDILQRDLYSNTDKIVENVNKMYAYRRHFVSLGVLTILKLTYLHFYKTIFVEISCEWISDSQHVYSELCKAHSRYLFQNMRAPAINSRMGGGRHDMAVILAYVDKPDF